jgi:hypothetical protein
MLGIALIGGGLLAASRAGDMAREQARS